MTTLSITTPMPPPAWALLQKESLRAQARACEYFYDRYFDERGYMRCVPRWGGDDGPDDAIENLTGWPVLYMMGGSEKLLDLCNLAQDGHIKQYTEAKTEDVPFCRDGMYYKEFPGMFDWLHNGESMSVFCDLGLCDPKAEEFERRVRLWSGFYMDEDPGARNYDPEHRIIRSLFNGSRGPMLRKATALDWTGDPIEEGRFVLAHGERNYQEMLGHFKDYTDVIGDHPSNMLATGLAFNAFALTGEEKYRDWILEYVDAWVERTRANGGIIPTNIGLDGTIGGACDGKWYGGCYGWGFTTVAPQTGQIVHRDTIQLALSGFGHALLLTGDRSYTAPWSEMIDLINENARDEDGVRTYPRKYGDDGWYNFTPEPYSAGAMETWYWSMSEAARARCPDDPWLRFLTGESPDYPDEALRADLATVREKVECVRNDPMTPDTRLSDNTNGFNPAIPGTLFQQTMGGPAPKRAQAVHCMFRYFDPVSRRPGLPTDVAALVDSIGEKRSAVTLVNTNPVEPAEVIIQGGAYREHALKSASFESEAGKENGRTEDVIGDYLRIRLEPGSGARLEISARRYANRPTLDFPW